MVLLGARGGPGTGVGIAGADECKEHDDVLRTRDVYSLKIGDVGNPGWDPICYISPEGFQYYFPAFVRLTLDGTGDTYLSQFLFHLTYEGAQNRHLQHFTPEQRKVVVALLRLIADFHRDIVEQQGCADELEKAISMWSSAEDVV